MILSIDAMGGDNAPQAILEGAELSLTSNTNLNFLLYGDEKILNPFLEKMPNLKSASQIFHTSKVIAMDESPANALRKEGRQSSMWLALEAVKENKADIAVSAGNTGALMGMAKLIFKSLEGIERPAMISRWPNKNYKHSLVLDLGANVSITAQQFVQFAAMGIAASKPLIGIDNPKVGLLNVGAEETKGPPELRQAALLCKKLFPDNFYGFIEGNDILSGIVDVIVTDGFSGNIMLKSAEGTYKVLIDLIKDEANSSLLAKIGGLLLRPAFRKLQHNFGPNTHSGGVFLGLNGLALKCHGGCDATGFSATISLAKITAEVDLIDRIKTTLPKQKLQELTHIKNLS